MANLFYMPEHFVPDRTGRNLTFVVPAKDGCNLACSFCIIRQRREIADNFLQPEDYAGFIKQVADTRPVHAIAIQGYEPLLREAMPFTMAILRQAAALCIPASLVTNGVCLAEAASELAEAPPRRIGVSLDAPASDLHDRIRGRSGAWTCAVAGIKKAQQVLSRYATEIDVISVLQRRNAAELAAIPALLNDLRVKNWIVDVVLRVRKDGSEAFLGNPAKTFQHLSGMVEIARSRSISIAIDDEFGLLRSFASANDFHALDTLPVRTLASGVTVSRLLPSGHCSVGSAAASGLSSSDVRWTSNANAGEFLDRLLASHREIAEAA